MRCVHKHPLPRSSAVGTVCHQPHDHGGGGSVRPWPSGRADPAGALRDGRCGAHRDRSGAVAHPRPALPGGGLPAAGGLPVRRSWLWAGVAPAGGRPGGHAGGCPDPSGVDQGPPSGRRWAAAGAVRPAARPGRRDRRRWGVLARVAGVRDRRHHDEHARQPGQPGQVHQTARPPRRVGLSAAAAAGVDRLRHPDLIDAVFGPPAAARPPTPTGCSPA